ncbi:MAG: acetoacetate--CoA ligase [Acidobacteria bacterium]|nr:acetoacetate--CoA ligase [Acidobacteriota bacterium]
MAQLLWRPSGEQIAEANITRFRERIGENSGASIPDYAALYRWSIDHAPDFWQGVWEFCGVIAERRGDEVVRDFNKMPGARWFPDARLNFAANLLRYDDDREALVSWNENGRQRALTYSELNRETARLAAALKGVGVQRGDRVAGFMPNLPETVITMLAATSLGAVWSSCSPDFGLQGVLDRFGQIKPKVIVTAAAYQYNGKTFDCLERGAEIARRIPSIEKVIVVPYIASEPDISSVRNATLYADFLAGGGDETPDFVSLPFDHPVYIMYSSGTTGMPKCIVHGAGGTLLQHLKELILHNDLRRDDRVFYFTTCGWMMWNWLVSSLATGATVVLFDGSPFHPGPGRLWDMAEQEKLTVFGTSAKYLAAIEQAGVEPNTSHDLSSLKAILSTGSPLVEEGFDYVYTKIKPNVRLSSISGGTDLISCFALGNPVGPVFRGQIQTRGLGMKVEVFDGSGRSLPPGEKGELVCTQPFPSMPVDFWNDPGDAKYRAAYFETFPNVWHHGDYCEVTPEDGMIIWGRSDAVLNPGGVRIGTAEIYRPVETIPDVIEAVAVGQNWNDDVRIILFVKLREGVELDDELAQTIRGKIRAEASPRHVPAKVIQIADIPRTLNGKIAELAVRNVIENRPVRNRQALANPEALDLYKDLAELQT